MFFFDPLYFLFAMPGLFLALWAQWKVKSTFAKYSQVRNMNGMTGGQAAGFLLRNAGLDNVSVEGTPGELSDHYDPRDKTLRLSPSVYSVPSVAALGIVAHEVGHAMQDKTDYLPLRLRAGLVPVANLGSTLGYLFFLLGVFMNATGLVWIGVLLFSGAAAFSLVTLPVEFNASSRAKQMLAASGMVSRQDADAVNSVLSAAAWTYVAALVSALGSLLYYVMIALGMSSRDRD